MYSNKIKELKGIIEKTLLPMLKGKKCILLDVPYYTNIGDTLIGKELWQGRIQNRFPMIYDWYWDKVMRPYYINLGVRFIGSYKLIYTTRLHGAILSVLLGKSLIFFDNSYGKNSSFYDTWLKDKKTLNSLDNSCAT